MQKKDPNRKRYYFEHLAFKGFWKIAWFGRITRLSEGGDTVSIYVYLGKLSPSDGLKYVLPLEYKRVQLPIGDLPVLSIGSVLEDGYLLFPEELPNNFSRTRDITLDLSKMNIRAVSRNENDGNGPIISMTNQWEFYQEPQADAYLLGIKHNENQFGVVIPCAEILRFFYCYASNIATVMTSHRIMNPGRYLYDPKKSFYDEAAGIVKLKPRTTVSESSAIYLANYISGYFDISRPQEMQKQISVQAGAERPFAVFPPLEGEVTLNVSFLTHTNHLGGQAIITRINHADLKPNFHTVAIGTRQINARKTDTGTATGQRVVTRVKNPPKLPVRLNPGAVNPALGVQNSYDGEISDRFPEFDNIARIALIEKTKSNGSSQIVSSEHAEGSTNNHGSSNSGAHKTIILPTDNAVDEEKTTAFERITKALSIIGATNLAIVDFIKLTELVQQADEKNTIVVYNLPNMEIKDAWVYLNRSENMRRRIIVASVVKEGKARYVIEFEQRSPGECSTLVVWNPIVQVPDEALLAVIEECIDNSGTYLTTNVFGRSWAKLRHSWKKNEHKKPDHFLNRIFEAGASIHGI